MSAVSSIASALGVSETSEPVSAAIEAYDPATGEGSQLIALQYYPETISDTRAVEWARRQIPGGSHPILTWISGGERVISFTAIFTQDRNPENQSALSQALTGTFDIGISDDKKRNVDADPSGNEQAGIPAAIAYLRSFTYPTYPNGAAKAPPLAIVYLPNSGIIGFGGYPGSIVGAMVECNVTYEAMHRNGAPRIAAVSLSFVEAVNDSPGWAFHSADDFANVTKLYGATGRIVEPVESIYPAPGGADAFAVGF